MEGEEGGFLPLAFVCRQPFAVSRAAACNLCKQVDAEPTARVCFPAVIRDLRASLMGRKRSSNLAASERSALRNDAHLPSGTPSSRGPTTVLRVRTPAQALPVHLHERGRRQAL